MVVLVEGFGLTSCVEVLASEPNQVIFSSPQRQYQQRDYQGSKH